MNRILFPVLVRILHQHGIVVLLVAGDFLAEPGRTGEGLILVTELNLGHDKSLIVPVKLVNLEGMSVTVNKIPCLVNDSGLADLQEVADILYRDFLLPFEAAGTAVIADSLYGDVALLALCLLYTSPSPRD